MLIYLSKCNEGEVPLLTFQRMSGWCEDIKDEADGRPGADFPNVGRGVRVCPLQQLKCPKGNSGGTAEFFALNAKRVRGVLF